MSEEPKYSFYVVKDRILTGVFEESHGRLPADILAQGYIEVEYIIVAASSNSYGGGINTSITPNLNTTRVVMDVLPQRILSNTSTASIMGCTYKANYVFSIGIQTTGILFYNLKATGTKNSTVSHGSRIIIDVNCPNRIVKFGDTTYPVSLGAGSMRRFTLFWSV